MNIEAFSKELKQLSADEIVATSKFVGRALLLKPGDRALVTNGMLIGPLVADESLSEGDIELLEKLAFSQGVKVYFFFFLCDNS